MSRFDSTGRLIIPAADDELKQELIVQKKGRLLVQELFCSHGHPLIRDGNEKFDGEPGIRLLCEGDNVVQEVYLSPFYKDSRRIVETEFGDKELLTLRCPECKTAMPALAPHDCRESAMYVSLFLTKKADIHNSVSVCDAWGCYASFLRLYSDVITDLRRIGAASR